jgi:hypothetical protein
MSGPITSSWNWWRVKTLAGPLLLDPAVDYARQIAEALEAAHERGSCIAI